MRNVATVVRWYFIAVLGPVSGLGLAGAGVDERAASGPAKPQIVVAEEIIDGNPPGIRVRGLRPSEPVRVHVLRCLEKWKNTNGTWQRVQEPLHAWAELTASADGLVEVDTARPLTGTYASPDPLALLRTGRPLGDPALEGVYKFDAGPFKAAPVDRMFVKLERQGAIAAEADFRLAGAAENLVFENVSLPGLNGVFAKPADGKDLRIVVALHGSEGGSLDKAKGKAGQFASQGFACLAVNYFAHPHEAISGVPSILADVPIETIDLAREWFQKAGRRGHEALRSVRSLEGGRIRACGRDAV